MDNGLVLTNAMFDGFKRNVDTSLNPYCSGQWSRTLDNDTNKVIAKVLILIVVDNGLVPCSGG